MTIQEERAALVKRIEEIDAGASFKPGWYVKFDYRSSYGLERIDNIKLYELYCSSWKNVEPFHKVAHKSLPPAHDPDFYHWWLSEHFDHSCDLADMERAWEAGMEHASKQEEQDDV